ncbi:hypothetical protein GCM10025861_21180 [Methanobacterium petrolearium]|nr:hypothetical protein GCM10025861_21180 [Methanobacterium petrolearium]
MEPTKLKVQIQLKVKKFLRFTASPIKDDEGNIIGGLESFEDISKRKTAEKNLKKSEKSSEV